MRDKQQHKDLSVVDSLYRISSLVGDTEEPREAFNFILDEIMAVLGATCASISLINPDSKQLQVEVYRGFPDDLELMDLRLGQGLTGWAAFMGKPVLVGDVRQDSRYVPVRDSILSEMAVPMEDSGNVIGVVNVDSEQLNAYTLNDLKILTLLTKEATRVVTKLWTIRKLREQAKQLESLVNTAQRLVVRHEIDDILVNICREAQNLMGYSLAAIYLINPSQQELRLQILMGEQGPLTFDETLRVDESSMEGAIRRRKQVEVLDLARTEEHHFIGLTQEQNLRSMLVTPLIFEDEVIGVLNVYTRVSHRFNNNERVIINALSSLGAIAIQNARFYNRIFESEKKLNLNERLTTLGLLAAEIAHEIRNPLTVLKLLFDAMDLDFSANDARSKDMEVIREKIDQLGQIVDRVLNFGQNRQEMHARWPLQTLLEETLQLARFKFDQQKVTVKLNAPDNKLWIDAHKGQIQQAMLNLLVNALDAMPEGGTITITLGQDEEVSPPRNWLSVEDTGVGIPTEIQSDIFDSFLTAKKNGTGLGLAIVKRIVRSHRGDVELLQTSNRGTVFRIWFPSASGND